MKQVFTTLSLVLLLAFTDNSKFLDKITAYQKDSYFKQKVYNEKDWRGFYSLPEANQKVDPKNYDMHLLNAALFYATNKYREERGASALKFSAGLRNAAVIHSNEMVTKGFYDHFNNKEKKLYSPDDRMKLFIADPGYSGETCDDNFVYTNTQETYIQIAEKIIDNLDSSPHHKAILLEKQFKYLGCGVMFEKAPEDNTLHLKATQDFTENN